MKDLREFDISFIGLKEGTTNFEYNIGNKFFDFFKYDEFSNSNLNVTLNFLKKATLFELNFKIEGWVELVCDVTNELFQQPIETDFELIVKFGSEYNNDDEELLILPFSEFKLNIAQNIYESIVLAIPLKRVHPGVIDGSLQSDVLEKLKELEIKNVEEKTNNKEIDPRWGKLKDIIIDKNTSNGTSKKKDI